MKKRIVLILLIVSMAFALSGCSALFFDTYYSEKEFQGNQSIDLGSDVQMVRNYSELRRLVFSSMNNHEEEMQLRFVGYTGNAVSDIASVCNAIKTESAYGAYVVDVISYDLTQIVSYYEASISISYKYTVDDLVMMQSTNNHESFIDILAGELRNESPKIVVRVNNGSSENSVVAELIEQTIREHPLEFSYYPEYSLKIYSGNSSQKIYEVVVQYDENMDNEERLKALAAKVDDLAEAGESDRTDVQIGTAAVMLRENCVFSLLDGNTAYDALVEGEADSEGIASAFKAVCDELGVECFVVKGKLNRAEHYWNIVKINDFYYHVDISAMNTRQTESLFKGDSEQQVDYWWDQSAYPGCKGVEIPRTGY